MYTLYFYYILGILYGNAYNQPRMEKELWRINRYLNLDRKHTRIPNVSFAFEFKNEIMTTLYVQCVNDKEGGAIVSYGDEQMQLTLGIVSTLI